jgi:hypothetical protein
MFLVHTSPGHRASRRRRATAAGLEHAVRRASEPAGGLTAEIPVERRAVQAVADRLLELAALMRSEQELPDAGVEAAHDLVTCGDSPLFLDGRRLPRAVLRIERAMGLR